MTKETFQKLEHILSEITKTKKEIEEWKRLSSALLIREQPKNVFADFGTKSLIDNNSICIKPNTFKDVELNKGEIELIKGLRLSDLNDKLMELDCELKNNQHASKFKLAEEIQNKIKSKKEELAKLEAIRNPFSFSRRLFNPMNYYFDFNNLPPIYLYQDQKIELTHEEFIMITDNRIVKLQREISFLEREFQFL